MAIKLEIQNSVKIRTIVTYQTDSDIRKGSEQVTSTSCSQPLSQLIRAEKGKRYIVTTYFLLHTSLHSPGTIPLLIK